MKKLKGITPLKRVTPLQGRATFYVRDCSRTLSLEFPTAKHIEKTNADMPVNVKNAPATANTEEHPADGSFSGVNPLNRLASLQASRRRIAKTGKSSKSGNPPPRASPCLSYQAEFHMGNTNFSRKINWSQPFHS
jgi:hypothetical protein